MTSFGPFFFIYLGLLVFNWKFDSIWWNFRKFFKLEHVSYFVHILCYRARINL